MTDRGLPIADGAPACPFVAFEDERDERASVPDHRHRCYAEPTPAPRALAHQEAYCLSSAFPVCPTFQDWARREAARASGQAAASPADVSGAIAAAAAAEPAEVVERPEPEPPEPPEPTEPPEPPEPPESNASDASDGPAIATPSPGSAAEVQRNPPRDWAAPPPWLASAESRDGADAEPPSFLGHRSTDPAQGLAGSPADQLAGGPPPSRRPSSGQEAWALGAAGAVAGAAAGGGGAVGGAGVAATASPAATADEPFEEEAVARPTRRPRAYDQHLGGPDGPDWEKPRRFEAYPTIKTRVGMPQVPRLALIAIAIGIAALALFFLAPVLLNVGGPSSPGGTPSPSATAAASLVPTEPPAPTPQIYTIKKGDTLLKVAKDHGLTLEELLAANKDIKNPNKVGEGQQIIIPVPSEAPPDQVTASEEPSASP